MSFLKKNVALQIVGDVERLALKPGDKVVITCPGMVSAEQAEWMREALESFFEGHKVVVLGDGAKLSVLEPTT